MRIAIILRKTKTGYSADAPDVPGCIAAAKTLVGTRRMMTKALEFHLEGSLEAGETLPKPRRTFSFAAESEAGEAFCTWVDVNVSTLV